MTRPAHKNRHLRASAVVVLVFTSSSVVWHRLAWHYLSCQSEPAGFWRSSTSRRPGLLAGWCQASSQQRLNREPVREINRRSTSSRRRQCIDTYGMGGTADMFLFPFGNIVISGQAATSYLCVTAGGAQ